jgi:hypothetical protein
VLYLVPPPAGDQESLRRAALQSARDEAFDAWMDACGQANASCVALCRVTYAESLEQAQEIASAELDRLNKQFMTALSRYQEARAALEEGT